MNEAYVQIVRRASFKKDSLQGSSCCTSIYSYESVHFLWAGGWEHDSRWMIAMISKRDDIVCTMTWQGWLCVISIAMVGRCSAKSTIVDGFTFLVVCGTHAAHSWRFILLRHCWATQHCKRRVTGVFNPRQGFRTWQSFATISDDFDGGYHLEGSKAKRVGVTTIVEFASCGKISNTFTPNCFWYSIDA